MQLEAVATNLGLLGFALAAVGYLVAFQQQSAGSSNGGSSPGGSSPGDSLLKLSFAVFTAATVATTVALASTARTASLGEVSGLLLAAATSWLAIGGHLRFRMKLLGAFVAPLATLILLTRIFVAHTRVGAVAVAAGSGSLLLKLHVTLAVLGQAFAILACGVSLLYLWQQSLLKRKLLLQMPLSLPAIDRLASALNFCLWGGFLLLTLGLLSGAWYTQAYPPSPELRLGWKVSWAVCVWIWYLATLLAKNVFNRPSKRIAQMSLAGFILLAMTFFGMGFGLGFLKPIGGGA